MRSKNSSKFEFYTDRKIRIYNKDVAEKIQEIYDAHNPRYNNYNAIMVEAIKFGLPYLLDEVAPQKNISQSVRSEADRIIKHLNRQHEAMTKQLQKILISSILTQEMITLLLHETEQILEQHSIKITPAIREQLKHELPEPFHAELQNLIKKLLNEEEGE